MADEAAPCCEIAHPRLSLCPRAEQAQFGPEKFTVIAFPCNQFGAQEPVTPLPHHPLPPQIPPPPSSPPRRHGPSPIAECPPPKPRRSAGLGVGDQGLCQEVQRVLPHDVQERGLPRARAHTPLRAARIAHAHDAADLESTRGPRRRRAAPPSAPRDAPAGVRDARGRRRRRRRR